MKRELKRHRRIATCIVLTALSVCSVARADEGYVGAIRGALRNLRSVQIMKVALQSARKFDERPSPESQRALYDTLRNIQLLVQESQLSLSKLTSTLAPDNQAQHKKAANFTNLYFPQKPAGRAASPSINLPPLPPPGRVGLKGPPTASTPRPAPSPMPFSGNNSLY